jgi:hypothetical protein
MIAGAGCWCRDLVDAAVVAKSSPAGVPQPTFAALAAGEMAVLHFADQYGLHPARPCRVLARRRDGEWMTAPRQVSKLTLQALALGVTESGADIADIDQVTGVRVVRAEQQTPHAAG